VQFLFGCFGVIHALHMTRPTYSFYYYGFQDILSLTVSFVSLSFCVAFSSYVVHAKSVNGYVVHAKSVNAVIGF